MVLNQYAGYLCHKSRLESEESELKDQIKKIKILI